MDAISATAAKNSLDMEFASDVRSYFFQNRALLLSLVAEETADCVTGLLDVVRRVGGSGRWRRTAGRCRGRCPSAAGEREAWERQRVLAKGSHLLPVVDDLELGDRHVERVARANHGGSWRAAHHADLTERGLTRFTRTQHELRVGTSRLHLADALRVVR